MVPFARPACGVRGRTHYHGRTWFHFAASLRSSMNLFASLAAPGKAAGGTERESAALLKNEYDTTLFFPSFVK